MCTKACLCDWTSNLTTCLPPQQLLLESRAVSSAGNLVKSVGDPSAVVANSQYLTLSALLSGSSTTTVKDKTSISQVSWYKVILPSLLCLFYWLYQSSDAIYSLCCMCEIVYSFSCIRSGLFSSVYNHIIGSQWLTLRLSYRVRVGGRKGAKEVTNQVVATPSVRVVTNSGHSLCVQAVVTNGTAPGSVRWVAVCVLACVLEI